VMVKSWDSIALIVAELRLLAGGALRHEYPYSAEKLEDLADRLEELHP
jgi:hypothetical protein